MYFIEAHTPYFKQYILPVSGEEKSNGASHKKHTTSAYAVISYDFDPERIITFAIRSRLCLSRVRTSPVHICKLAHRASSESAGREGCNFSRKHDLVTKGLWSLYAELYALKA